MGYELNPFTRKLDKVGAAATGGGGTFNAGVSTLGNTVGDTGMVTNRLVLAGGNNITLSQSTNAGGATVSISGGAGGGITPALSGSNGSFSYSTATFGNLNGMSFYTSNGSLVASYTVPTQTAYVFSNSNGLTFGTNGSTVTASHNGLTSQSNQALSGSNGSFTFQTATFGNLNGMSFYTSNGSLVGSYTVPTQTNQTLGLYGSGNTSGTSTGTVDARSLTFNVSGSLTVDMTNGRVNISAPNALTTAMASNRGTDFVQANAAFNGTNASGTIASNNISVSVANASNSSLTMQAGASTLSSVSRIAFGDGNGVSFGASTSNNGSITITATVKTDYQSSNANYLTSQSNQAVSAANGSYAFQTLSMSNANGMSFGTSAGSAITGSYTVPTVTQYFSNTGTTFNGANISGSLTLNTNGLQASLSVAAPGAAAENNNINLLGANTAGNTTASGSTIGYSGINLTLSGTNNSVVNISAPATSSLSATGQVSIVTNASTISIGVPAAITVSRYNEFKEAPLVAGNQGQATLHIQPWLIPNLHMDRAVLGYQLSNASNSSFSITLSQWMGIYTKNASTLSLLHSASNSTNFSGSGTAGSYSLYGGLRGFSVGLTQTLTEGMYWLGVINRTTTGGGAGHTINQLLASQINSSWSGELGVASNATKQMSLGLGVYTASTSAMPASIGFTQINGNSSVFLRAPQVQLVSGTV